MGCVVSSQNAHLGNTFKVYNVDEKGRRNGKGYLSVTEAELVYRQGVEDRLEEHIWPLKWLRKYGYDRNIFSFEAGHKCQGGGGIYAFSTKHAFEIFIQVEHNIKSRPTAHSEPGTLNQSNGTAGSLEDSTNGGRYAITPPTGNPTKPVRERSKSTPRPTSTSKSPSKDPSPSAAQTPSTPLSQYENTPSLTLSQVDSKVSLKSQSLEPQPVQAYHSPEHTPPPIVTDVPPKQFSYAQLDLPAPSKDKPSPKTSKVPYTEVIVEKESDPQLANGGIGGEYVNYDPSQGLKSPSKDPPQAIYKNMMFHGSAEMLGAVAPSSYAMLDFAEQQQANGHSQPSSLSPRSKSVSTSVLPQGKESTNYAQLDIKAMEATAHLRDTKERVTRQRH